MTFWAATYLEDHTGLTRATAAAGVSLFLIGMLAGRLTGTRLSLRGVHTPTLLRAALVLALLGFLVYRLTTSTALVLTGLFLTGLGVATLWPLALAQAVQAAPGNSDAAAARASFAAGTAISLAPLSLGALADWFGIATAYWIVALLLITALVMHTRLQAPPPHSLGGDPWAKRNGQR